jgi:hypothetical protein
MIYAPFIFAIFFVVNGLLGKMDTINANNGFSTSILTANGYISSIYSFLPLITITILAILLFDLIFEGSYLLFKAIYWVIRRFPTQS